MTGIAIGLTTGAVTAAFILDFDPFTVGFAAGTVVSVVAMRLVHAILED